MAIHITKNGMRATGNRDASALLIAMAPDETILKWHSENHGSELFQQLVADAVKQRRLIPDQTEK
jgi:hypothetical protein